MPALFPALFIAGAGTDVGKTYVTCGLIRALRHAGAPVRVLKPIVSGIDPADWADSDPGRLLNALGARPTLEALDAISPWRCRAPLSPDMAARLEGRTIDFEAVVAFCRQAIDDARDATVLIEGVGGVMSPLSDDQTNLDLIEALGAPVVLVAGSYLGTISHALTALEVLRARGVEIAATVISDSGEGAPSLTETTARIAHQNGGAPVFGLPRNAAESDWAPIIAALAMDRRPGFLSHRSQ